MERFSNILLLADAGLEKSIALKRALALANTDQASLLTVKPSGFVSPVSV